MSSWGSLISLSLTANLAKHRRHLERRRLIPQVSSGRQDCEVRGRRDMENREKEPFFPYLGLELACFQLLQTTTHAIPSFPLLEPEKRGESRRNHPINHCMAGFPFSQSCNVQRSRLAPRQPSLLINPGASRCNPSYANRIPLGLGWGAKSQGTSSAPFCLSECFGFAEQS